MSSALSEIMINKCTVTLESEKEHFGLFFNYINDVECDTRQFSLNLFFFNFYQKFNIFLLQVLLKLLNETFSVKPRALKASNDVG